MSKSMKSFPIFEKLPTELRLLIWGFARHPRIVYLQRSWVIDNHQYCYRVRSDASIDDPYSFFDATPDGLNEDDIHELGMMEEIGPHGNLSGDLGTFSRCQPPVLFSVCRESREFALKHYELAFGTVRGRPEVWFDFEVDILYVDWGQGDDPSYDPQDLSPFDMERVQNLVLWGNEKELDEYSFPGSPAVEHWVTYCLTYFPNVRKLTRDVMGEKSYTPLNLARSLVFHDPILVKFWQYYNNKGLPLTDSEQFNEHVICGHPSEYMFDMTKLQQALDYWCNEDGSKATQKLPEIDYKLVVTPDIKHQLTMAEAKYSKDHRESDCGSCWR
jgi:hypothetical protein